MFQYDMMALMAEFFISQSHKTLNLWLDLCRQVEHLAFLGYVRLEEDPDSGQQAGTAVLDLGWHSLLWAWSLVIPTVPLSLP